MCGRFALWADTEKVKKRYNSPQMTIELFPSNNISPGMMIPVVIDDGGITIQQMKWGLVPHWAEDPAIGVRLINARAETVAEKPAFKDSFIRKRCLIPATGFYEWKHLDNGIKQPYYIHIKDREIISLAGLWDEWLDAEKRPIHTCTIITTQANSVLAPIHDRMPVILREDDEENWLMEKFNSTKLSALLHSYNESDIEMKHISPDTLRRG